MSRSLSNGAVYTTVRTDSSQKFLAVDMWIWLMSENMRTARQASQMVGPGGNATTDRQKYRREGSDWATCSVVAITWYQRVGVL